jgi:inhibitor of KinA sporulation pathway (predicted exonuclease)
MNDTGKILVVDLESTCWDTHRGFPPKGQMSEIIEIGVCLLDSNTWERSAKKSILVKPSWSKVSQFCTELTTLTQEQVDQGVSFPEALQILEQEYDSKSRLWMSWGDYDRKMFENQCRISNLAYPFSDKHINAKQLEADHSGRPHQKKLGMVRAMAFHNLNPEGTHHRGDDDAWNIALILSKILPKIDFNPWPSFQLEQE